VVSIMSRLLNPRGRTLPATSLRDLGIECRYTLNNMHGVLNHQHAIA